MTGVKSVVWSAAPDGDQSVCAANGAIKAAKKRTPARRRRDDETKRVYKWRFMRAKMGDKSNFGKCLSSPPWSTIFASNNLLPANFCGILPVARC